MDEQWQGANEACARALMSPEMTCVTRALAAAAITVDECMYECARITEVAQSRRRLKEIRDAAARRTVDLPPGSFERFVLAHATRAFRNERESAAVAPVVKRLALAALLRFVDGRTVVDLAEYRFAALCMLATARRFTAGQFDWERSGLPRSWLGRVRPLSALTRLLSMVIFQWHAFGPVYFSHLTVTYSVRALLEREALKSYYRMAQSMALQSDIHGLITSSWFHSPDTFAVTPHLAWLNRVFADNGAIVATMGAAEPDCGVLAQSAERQQAFTDGRFKPTLGLIVWPRREMLAWAAAHPELDR